MKKILPIFGALVLAMALISCGEANESEYSGAQDTVISLATPSVTAKAYPGYNLISWNPVANVKKWELYRYEDGNVTDKTVVALTANTTFYEDTSDLQNNVSYTYKVMAVGSVSGRAVVTQDSAAGSATVTAIVPPLSTSPLNLAAYESGYDGKEEKTLSESEKTNYLLSADSTDITSNLKNLGVAIRAKAYLTYNVYLDKGDKYDSTKNLLAADKATLASGKNSTIENNTVLPMTAAVTTAGDYTVYVEVRSKSSYFINSDIVKVGTINYDVLEATSNPAITSAAYVDNGNTIRIAFNGVTFATGVKSTASNFIVYRNDAAANGYTAVSGTITENPVSPNTYFVDDTISDNTKNYQYIVVLTDGAKYGRTVAAKEVAAYAGLTTTANLTIASAAYVDAGNTIRITFNGVTLTNGAKTTASNFIVYRYDTTTSEYTAVSGTITENPDSPNTYFVDDAIADNTKAYKYIVVLMDGTKVEKASAAKDVAAYSGLASVTAGNVSGVASVLDSDGLANDITWTVTLNSATDTFKAYLLTKDAAYTATPKAADFDTTTALSAVSEDNTDGKTWKIYTKDVAVGKSYLLVVYSAENKKDSYKTSAAVTVSDIASVAAPSLTVTPYDSTVTGATTSTSTVNDVIINVKDTIDIEKDSVSNYTYTLYRTTSTVKTDILASSITFKADTADWAKVAEVAMNSNDGYKSSATSISYIGVVKEEELADGVYAYKIVKSLKSNAAVSAAVIQYVTITAKGDANKIVYTPINLTASWTDSSKVSSTVTVEFVKNNTSNDPIEETHSEGTPQTAVVGYVPETMETGVTYTIWRAALAASSSSTEVVYTKLGAFASSQWNTTTAVVQKWNSESNVWESVTNYSYVDSITYSYTDEGLSTGNSYSYIIVASKNGADDVISATVSVAGAN